MRKFFIFLIIQFGLIAIGNSQTLQNDLSLKYLSNNNTNSKKVIILLHGYGSNESDLFGLQSFLPNDFLIISARAPQMLKENSFAWFDISFDKDGVRGFNYQQALKSRLTLAKFIDEIAVKYKIAKNDIHLIGFSQGAIMSYGIAFHYPEKIKGIAALSGRILDEDKQFQLSDKHKNIRFIISHGTNDAVIKIEQGRNANNYLKNLGLKVQFFEYEMGHQINNDVLLKIKNWLSLNY